jgi:cellulose synthase/poly-beta-1,6-N-acetylglucosamine synthase-like glycosyltransferase
VPAFRPRVSVIIPARDAARTVSACLEGVLAQTYPRERLEIIVVDNASRDDTRALASRSGVVVLDERLVLTSYAARNRGARHATGEVLAFTDADCVPANDWLDQLVRPFDDGAVAAVTGHVDDAPALTLCEELTARIRPFARPQRNGLETLLTVNVAIRRDSFHECGGFDEMLPTGGDVDLGWRMQQKGFRLTHAPAARVAHRHRSTLRRVFAQYRRYGFSEILLATLHGDRGAVRPIAAQPKQIALQMRAMATYILALGYRLVLRPFRNERGFLLWPVFLFAVELGNVVGKIDGLIATRGGRRNPFANARLGRR